MARKRQQDVSVLHGHHVVTGPELRATFAAARADQTARVRRRVLHGIVLVLLAGLIAAAIITALAIIGGQLKIPAAAPAEVPADETPEGAADAAEAAETVTAEDAGKSEA